jgi:hypothetical protein
MRKKSQTGLRSARPDMAVGFGARRVDSFLNRLRLHLETDRFLAARRRDPVWEAGCDYAVLALGRLASRLRPSTMETAIPRAAPPREGAALTIAGPPSASRRGRRVRLLRPRPSADSARGCR